jgi:hypothetical protein
VTMGEGLEGRSHWEAGEHKGRRVRRLGCLILLALPVLLVVAWVAAFFLTGMSTFMSAPMDPRVSGVGSRSVRGEPIMTFTLKEGLGETEGRAFYCEKVTDLRRLGWRIEVITWEGTVVADAQTRCEPPP